jgi:hypothetical protein
MTGALQQLFSGLPEEALSRYTPMLGSLTPAQQAGLFETRPSLFPMETALPLTFQISDFFQPSTFRADARRNVCARPPAGNRDVD